MPKGRILLQVVLYSSLALEWSTLAFTASSVVTRSSRALVGRTTTAITIPTAIYQGTNQLPDLSENDDDDDDEVAEPGKMRVSEIKAELDLREVAYGDCFDKEALVQRLRDARATGKADPSILQQFNKQKLEQQFSEEKKVELRDEDIDAAVANDGTLPGGLTPDMFKKLTGSPEIMSLLQSTKMQEAMRLMMTGGRDELEQKIKEDPELQETVEKLDSIMKSLQ